MSSGFDLFFPRSADLAVAARTDLPSRLNNFFDPRQTTQVRLVGARFARLRGLPVSHALKATSFSAIATEAVVDDRTKPRIATGLLVSPGLRRPVHMRPGGCPSTSTLWIGVRRWAGWRRDASIRLRAAGTASSTAPQRRVCGRHRGATARAGAVVRHAGRCVRAGTGAGVDAADPVIHAEARGDTWGLACA